MMRILADVDWLRVGDARIKCRFNGSELDEQCFRESPWRPESKQEKGEAI